MLDQLPDSLPALTALATVIAASIGAIVAVVVARTHSRPAVSQSKKRIVNFARNSPTPLV